MIDLVRAIDVELLKLRRTLVLAVALVVPVALLGMIAANVLSRDVDATLPGNSPWNALIVNFAYFLWCVLALPLLVLGLGLGLEGSVLNVLRPSLGLIPPIPWLDILRGMSAMFGATLLLLALLTWVQCDGRASPCRPASASRAR